MNKITVTVSEFVPSLRKRVYCRTAVALDTVLDATLQVSNASAVALARLKSKIEKMKMRREFEDRAQLKMFQ